MHKPRKYCPKCAKKIERRLIEDRERDFCPACEEIYYDNPAPVVSALLVNKKREVLLVLRDREPHEGMWCLPSGFMELHESISEAVLRELKEETGIEGRVFVCWIQDHITIICMGI